MPEDEITCSSCKREIAEEEISFANVTDKGKYYNVICVNCRPPGNDSDKIDDDTSHRGYEGYLDEPDWQEDNE